MPDVREFQVLVSREPTRALPEFHVLVKFGAGIPGDAQGQAMLAFEKLLRFLTKQDVEVFKESRMSRSLRKAWLTIPSCCACDGGGKGVNYTESQLKVLLHQKRISDEDYKFWMAALTAERKS